MWLKSDRSNRWRFAASLFVVACSCSTWAYAGPVSVCAKHSHAGVTQIDIFDGKPEDQAYLAPDDPDAMANTYTVGKIYDQGRVVVVRCHYSDGLVRDVVLKQRTRTCHYIAASKKRSAALTCK